MRVTSTTDGRPLSSASAPPTGPGPPTTAGPHRDTGTGGSSASHFPTVPSLAADDATVPVTSTGTILAASPSLDAALDAVAGATATATSTAGVDMEVDTDPAPITAVPPTAGRISSFLSYIRRSIADDATATAASAAGALATHPSPDVDVGANDGATANAASTAAASLGSSGSSVFSPSAAGDTTGPTASAVATLADPPSLVVAVGTADSATATHTTTDVHPTDDATDDDAADTRTSAVDAGDRVSPPRKRHRHFGPTEVAQRRLRQQTHTQTDDTAADTAADTHASASVVDSGPQVSPPRKRRRNLGPAEAARIRLHQQTRTPRSPPSGHE